MLRVILAVAVLVLAVSCGPKGEPAKKAVEGELVAETVTTDSTETIDSVDVVVVDSVGK